MSSILARACNSSLVFSKPHARNFQAKSLTAIKQFFTIGEDSNFFKCLDRNNTNRNTIVRSPNPALAKPKIGSKNTTTRTAQASGDAPAVTTASRFVRSKLHRWSELVRLNRRFSMQISGGCRCPLRLQKVPKQSEIRSNPFTG